MKIKNDIWVNNSGLEIPIQMAFVDKINEWCLDSYNTAKCLVYQDATKLLPHDDEANQIGRMMLKLEGIEDSLSGKIDFSDIN